MVLKRLLALLSLICISRAWPQETQTGATSSQSNIQLSVEAGTPIRLYLTKRIPKRAGAPVEARTITPLYAFDREVVPAGAVAQGRVSRVQPVSKVERTRAIFNGDFTPLRVAEVQFTSLQLPDGKKIPLQTLESSGLNSIYPVKPPKPPKTQTAPANSGAMTKGKRALKDQIDSRVSAVKGIPDMVKAPGKKEWLEDFLWSKLPYHPQAVRSRTRFDAQLTAPLAFGSTPLDSHALTRLGSQPEPGSKVHAWLLTPLDSKTSSLGEKVEAIVSEPLFSSTHQLLIPEGTRLTGAVVQVKKAGWFHHGGRLRFTFQKIELQPQAEEARTVKHETPALPNEHKQEDLILRTQANLAGAESGGKAKLKVDGEGGVQAQESKTRFLGTAVAALVAANSGPGDRDRNSQGVVNGPGRNTGGRILGGGMGFGLLGSIAAQTSTNVSRGLGYYGLAWSVFSTVIAHGSEVQFDRNAALDIGFDARPR